MGYDIKNSDGVLVPRHSRWDDNKYKMNGETDKFLTRAETDKFLTRAENADRLKRNVFKQDGNWLQATSCNHPYHLFNGCHACTICGNCGNNKRDGICVSCDRHAKPVEKPMLGTLKRCEKCNVVIGHASYSKNFCGSCTPKCAWCRKELEGKEKDYCKTCDNRAVKAKETTCIDCGTTHNILYGRDRCKDCGKCDKCGSELLDNGNCDWCEQDKASEEEICKTAKAKLKLNATKPKIEKKKKKEEKTMASNTARNRVSNGALDAIKESVKHGAQVALADEASSLVLALAKQMFGTAYPQMFETADGQEVAKGLAAVGLLYANEMGIIPAHQDGVNAACGLVLEAVSRDLVQPRLALLKPMLHSLADVGTSVLKASSPSKTASNVVVGVLTPSEK